MQYSVANPSGASGVECATRPPADFNRSSAARLESAGI